MADLCQQHDVLCISDEVYQWLVYDGHQHVSIGERGLPHLPLDTLAGLEPTGSSLGLVIRTQGCGPVHWCDHGQGCPFPEVWGMQ